MINLLLAHPDAQHAIGDQRVLDVLLWHALEENEHKAVAFDVYKAVGGSERTRVQTMNLITFGFLVGMTLQAAISVLGDRTTYRTGEVARSLRRLRGSPFVRKEVWRRLRDYNRPDFHPDDHDTTELLEQWREVLFGDPGTLNDKLTVRATVAA